MISFRNAACVALCVAMALAPSGARANWSGGASSTSTSSSGVSDISGTGSISATTAAAVTVAPVWRVSLNGMGTVGLTVTGIAGGAVLTPVYTSDNGVTWSAGKTLLGAATVTADGRFEIDAVNKNQVGLQVTTAGTGSITVAWTASVGVRSVSPTGGTAGTPSGNVLTVQGASSMTPIQVGGTVSVSNLAATQPISGSVSVGNFPATQPVSGTLSVSNIPALNAATDFSGTITAGGTAQTVTVATGFTFCNPSASAGIWIAKFATAAPNGVGSIYVAPLGYYATEPREAYSGTLSIYGATTGQPFTGTKF